MGIADSVLAAIVRANAAPATANWGGYGADPVSRAMKHDAVSFFEVPESRADQFFIWPLVTGTAANDLLLFALAGASNGDGMNAVLCSECAHIYTDEMALGGGLKLLPIPARPGTHAKLTPADIDAAMRRYSKVMFGGIVAVSLSQATESGTVYTAREVRALCEIAHHHGLLVHMDGARFLNAVAADGCSPAELSWAAGVDVLSFGGSKAGALVDAAVVFDTNRVPVKRMILYAKQRGHLASKQRFLACQLSALLKDDEGIQLALKANLAAQRLANGLANLGLAVRHPCEANCVFVTLPAETRDALDAAGFGFFVWDGRPDTEDGETRFVCSFRTSDSDVDQLLAQLAMHHKSS